MRASTLTDSMRKGRFGGLARSAWAAVVLLTSLTIALSACGGESSLPSGVYTSQQYHFRVTYPAGWQVNTSSQPNATAPLIVIITRSGSTAIPGSLLSSLTVNVLSMSASSVADSANSLSSNSALTATTVGGQPGFRDKSVTETGSGATSSDTLTHTEYYVVHGGYLYQISADALAGDGAAVDAMTQSFTLLS